MKQVIEVLKKEEKEYIESKEIKANCGKIDKYVNKVIYSKHTERAINFFDKFDAKTAKNIEQTTNARLKTDEKELDYTIQKIDAGTMDNLDLLFQKQRLIVSKMQNVSAKTNVIISALNLYQALGGVDFSELENIQFNILFFNKFNAFSIQ